MPRHGYQPQWHGPYRALDDALDAAHRVADRTQRGVSVYEAPTAAATLGFVLGHFEDGPPAAYRGARFVSGVHPNPKAAPKRTWPVVHLFASTERVQRDVQAESWRQQNDRGALAALGVTNGLKPYGLSVSEVERRVAGFRVVLYSLTVRRNPSFPHDKLAIPMTPIPPKAT